MENSYRYFENKECHCYPCHKDMDDVNCLFCYCPLYKYNNCLGTYYHIKEGAKKDCSECNYPHDAQNYDSIIKFLKENQ